MNSLTTSSSTACYTTKSSGAKPSNSSCASERLTSSTVAPSKTSIGPRSGFHFNPGIPRAKVIDLATCAFVQRREVVCLVGPAGVGKSHLAQALGHRACMAGHTALYVSANRMLEELRAARADQSYQRHMLRFSSPDLLILDDLGLRPLRYDEPQDLYELIRRRYERGATVITSNRSVTEWYPLFGDPLLASAAMDRLLHHAHVIEMEGDSYRNPPPEKQRKAKAQACTE